MLQVGMKDMIVHHRYFIKDKQNKYLYFGTVTHVGDGIKIMSAFVNMYNSNFYTGWFTEMVFYSYYNFYIYIPYKMEEIMLNKILKQLLGNDFFYPLGQHMLDIKFHEVET